MELNLSNVLYEAYKNSSGYLLISIAVAIGSFIFVWISEKSAFSEIFNKKAKQSLTGNGVNEESPEGESPEGLLGRVDLRSLADQIAAEMTPQQKEQEKEVERQQLAAILKLLKEQENDPVVSNMKYLEEQLSLYR